MVSGTRNEGGTQILTAGVRKTIMSIKEIVGNHSDAEIYVALKETNMDPNETAQKLLNQDPFHEVRRKRDKRKENTGYKSLTEPQRRSEHAGQGMKFNTSERDVRRGGYSQNAAAVAGGSREFRIVRDNQINQNTTREVKPPLVKCSTSTNDQVHSNVSENSSTGTSTNQKSSGVHNSSKALLMPTISNPRQSRDTNSSGSTGKGLREERRAPVSTVVTQVQGSKLNDSQLHSEGVYSSSFDPVHVPSPDSIPAATIGAIRRERGAIGIHRQSSASSAKLLSEQSSLSSTLHMEKHGSSSSESFRPSTANSRNGQPHQTTAPDSVVPTMSVSRSFLNNVYNSRSHQQIVGHQKASQPSKEWKPKLSQNSSVNGAGVIGTPAISLPHPAENPEDLETDAAQVQDKPSQVNNSESQNVIIAEHIRVSESDRYRLTFGSFGTEFDFSRDFVSDSHTAESAENSYAEHYTSLSASAPESASDETSASKHVDLLQLQVQNSDSNSPASSVVSEQLLHKKESSSPQDLDNYADIGLVRYNSASYTPSESQQQQDTSELPSFSAYDPQSGYDIPYFRPTADETVRGQGLPFPREAFDDAFWSQAFSSHTANSIPASTVPMVQQQPSMAQMYPPVQISHFANLMPYRQYLSPVYVPPMPMPGYSGNATYSHPSNGSSYLLMPGGSAHLNANSLKYGMQQFKPIPAGSPTGFGNFTSPTGYAINAPGVVGSAAGLEDPSRLKYKDGNLYVPNLQAETSEIWIQNPRELSGMQSASYYNIPGQTPHAAYLSSHTGHASFNAAAAAAQSSHMQFPGLYHHPPPPPPPTGISNPHHLGPSVGGNAGVGAAPGAQLGAYQQPQLGHLNWTGNF